MNPQLVALLDKELMSIGRFGTVHITLKKNNDIVTTADLTKIGRRKVSGSAQALTLIGSMLKLLKENDESGNLTFTITLEKGDSTQLMTHDFRRTNLNGGQYT